VTALSRLLPVHQDWKRQLGLLQPLAGAGRTADPGWVLARPDWAVFPVEACPCRFSCVSMRTAA